MTPNPFHPADTDRHPIWEMLVARDIDAFVARSWEMVAGDFVADGFTGIDGKMRSSPDGWTIRFPDLATYRDEWVRQAEEFASNHVEVDPISALRGATILRDIEIRDDRALVHKKFDGRIRMRNGGFDHLHWQSLYHCRRVDGVWRITGFTGYLPFHLGADATPQGGGVPAKQVPAGASQHTTAGPYSSVLSVSPGRLVVTSGQAALNQAGEVVGDDIETQTKVTLENCFRQLTTAGCCIEDIFKVNIFMSDLGEWSRMNEVYSRMISSPQPVRTAVETPLLMDLKIEIEMWAVGP